MNILVLNAGSSSLKFRLFRIEQLLPLSASEQVLVTGQIEQIGHADSRMSITYSSNGVREVSCDGIGSLAESVQTILLKLTKGTFDERLSAPIDVVGHRIVHGGTRFSTPVLINEALLEELRALQALAPQHNPVGVTCIEEVRRILPNSRSVAVFDTAFHRDLPAVAATYALPAELSSKLHLRRFGFHGISYRYVHERLSLMNQDTIHPIERFTRMIICHLGNGASVCAIRDGQSIDTSMGFTPLEGLIMGTRSGDIDPGLILYLQRTGEMTTEQVDDLINYQSGLLGLSGKSSDLREVEKSALSGDKASELALECFAYRVRKYIGAYAAVLGGVDALVFTGGIGENSASMRARICDELDFLGLGIDALRNASVGGQAPVCLNNLASGKVWMVPTDEERQIGREVFTLLN